MKMILPVRKSSRSGILLLLLLLQASSGQAQQRDYGDYDGGGDDYQDYADPYSQQDNLYADYVAHQQEKRAAVVVVLGEFFL